MATVLKSSLKFTDLFLLPTGETLDGMEEYVYIGEQFGSNRSLSAGAEFIRLKKLNEEEFEVVNSPRGVYHKYSVQDGRPFTDINGQEVYVKNEDGSVKMELVVDSNGDPILDADGNQQFKPMSRLQDYTRNATAIGAILAPEILKSIKAYLGY